MVYSSRTWASENATERKLARKRYLPKGVFTGTTQSPTLRDFTSLPTCIACQQNVKKMFVYMDLTSISHLLDHCNTFVASNSRKGSLSAISSFRLCHIQHDTIKTITAER
jgi:hypothetical protein